MRGLAGGVCARGCATPAPRARPLTAPSPRPPHTPPADVQWLWPLHEPSAFAVVFPVLTRQQVAELSASAEARGRMLASLARFRLFYGLPAEAEGGAAGAPAADAAAAPAAAAEAAAGGGGAGGSSSGGGGGGGGGADSPRSPGGSSSSSRAQPAEPAAGEAAIGAAGEGAAPPPAPAAAAAPAANEGLPPGFSPARAALWASNGDHNLLRVTRIIRSLRFFGLQAQSDAFYRDVLAVARWAGLSRTTLGFWRKAHEEDVWASMRR